MYCVLHIAAVCGFLLFFWTAPPWARWGAAAYLVWAMAETLAERVKEVEEKDNE